VKKSTFSSELKHLNMKKLFEKYKNPIGGFSQSKLRIKMKTEKLDKRNFMIHFNSALTNKDVGDLFFKFLKSEFNESLGTF
jgi:hypothetical protein